MFEKFPRYTLQQLRWAGAGCAEAQSEGALVPRQDEGDTGTLTLDVDRFSRGKVDGIARRGIDLPAAQRPCTRLFANQGDGGIAEPGEAVAR